MKPSAIWRATGVLGAAASVVLAASSLSMAATITTTTTEGTITIQTTSNTAGTATWNWSGLQVGEYVSVYAAPKSDPTQITLLPTSSGSVTTNGDYSAAVTLPGADTWSNTEIEMVQSAMAVGQLPEVPWAAMLPLLLLVPVGISLWRDKTKPSN